jgi:hypothetical protein
VRGSHWEVEWATDEYLREATEFFHRFVAGNATNEEFIERCEARPAAMVCDLTINQKQGVPA